jgi:hypothetical protein
LIGLISLIPVELLKSNLNALSAGAPLSLSKMYSSDSWLSSVSLSVASKLFSLVSARFQTLRALESGICSVCYHANRSLSASYLPISGCSEPAEPMEPPR